MFTKKQTNILKGIAVLLLLIHHSWAPLKTETMPVYGEAIKTMTSMGKLSVAIFAILSGYGMFKSAEKKDRSVWEGVLAHILKVYTVFWLTGGLLAALVSASNGGLSVLYGRMPVYHLLLDLLALSHIARTPMLANSWWYVNAALLYYCFFPFFYGGIAKLKKGNYILWLLSAMWLMLHPGTNTILVYGIFFVMGMILAERDLPSRLLALCDRYFVADLLLFPLIGGLAGSLYVRQTFLSGLKAEYYLDWLPALFVILITAILTASIPDLFPGPLELTGSLSFEIFLIHGAFIKYAPHLVYPDDICGLVLLRLYGLSLAGALVIRLVTRQALPWAGPGPFDRLYDGARHDRQSGDRRNRTLSQTGRDGGGGLVRPRLYQNDLPVGFCRSQIYQQQPLHRLYGGRGDLRPEPGKGQVHGLHGGRDLWVHPGHRQRP